MLARNVAGYADKEGAAPVQSDKVATEDSMLRGLDGFMVLMAFVSIILTNQFSTWLPECQLHSK